MNKNKVYLVLCLSVLVTFFSCKQKEDSGISKNITGKPGELVVVISNQAWEGNSGKVIRETMAQEHLALPQDEPLFDLIKVPREAFTSIFKTTRNIIQTQISSTVDSTGITFMNNVWSNPQAVVIVQAKNEEDFIELFHENHERILSFFLKAERDRLTMNYEKYYERGIFNVLEENFDFTMKVGPGFQIAKQKENFIWLRYETPEISGGIVLYTFPYESDSAFTANYQIQVRDSLLKMHIPGTVPESYMATEKRVDQLYNFRHHHGNYASEMRGLWRLINDYMGGPYISLAVLDATNQRVV
ncbi:MAG: DUF4837 family protein, partial [Mariniphaga sp.]|nr:DUF4837 family protein [Mariniphaga sp.]